ncbi:hypothetical protein HELRODRAFT_175105 [Helobdella robusta]|uniref:Uncharacterized protein n=1 Tax=Helobdella robusta TaxID=6412 RepID=T1F8V0_HELRO|nr:hypothetical protein HELRODRAFT_175105 [Helobdella robusta]ESO01078.1 hypothetical protein HELRODRAFT_175105 [Helobdella robusta]
MAGKGRSTKNSNSDALRCEKESTDVQCVCCGISFAVGMTEESLELLKACDNVKFVCDECLKSPSIKDQVIKTVESGKAGICDKINSLSKEIRSEIDAIKVKLEANEGKMSGLDVPGSKLCDEISNFRNEMTRSFASVVSSEVVKSVQIINDDVKKVQKTLTNVMESKEREANIVVFRLSEGTDDRNRVCKIISHLTGGVCGETNIIKLVRLGKKNDTVVRPILVKFDDVKVKELVFKNVFKMKSVGDNLSHVGLSHDLTVEQRDELKKLMDDARQMEKNSTEGFLYRVRGDVGKWKIVHFPARKEFVRSWKNIDEDRFIEAVLNSPLSGSCLSNDVDDELKIFNEELKSIIDRLVPKRVIFDRAQQLQQNSK